MIDDGIDEIVDISYISGMTTEYEAAIARIAELKPSSRSVMGGRHLTLARQPTLILQGGDE